MKLKLKLQPGLNLNNVKLADDIEISHEIETEIKNEIQVDIEMKLKFKLKLFYYFF